MGCWNNTCQISQLPIMAGDPVRFMLLTKSPYRGDEFKSPGEEKTNQPNGDAGREGVYSGNFWYPEFVPVRAEYNDYGSVQSLDVKCHNWQYWQETINERIVEYPLGPNQYHDPASTKGMSVEDLLNVLQEGRLRFKEPYYRVAVPVSQTMIREDVFESILSIRLEDEETWWLNKDGDPFTPETIYEHGMKMFSAPHPKSHIIKGIAGMEDLFDDLDYGRANYFSSGMHESEGERGVKPYRAWIRKGLKDGTLKLESPEFKALIKDIADFMYVRSVHANLRLTWHPGTGQGSQSSNFQMAKQFHRNIANIAIKARKKYHDDY